MKTLPILVGAITALLPCAVSFAQSTSASAASSARNATTASSPGTMTTSAASSVHSVNGNATSSTTPKDSAASGNAKAMPPDNHPASDAPKEHLPDPHASANSNAVQAILHQFDSSRDQLVSQRQALIDQLAAAKTDTERNAILAELHDEQKSMQDSARATAKEIRAELQNLRHQRGGG